MAKTDTQQDKTKRELALERLQSRHPDSQFADDEAIFGQIGEDYEDYDKRIAGYQERETAFSNMFGSDPRTANFLMDWKNGKDPLIEFVRRFGKDALEDETKLEEIAAANKEFLERIAENEALEKSIRRMSPSRLTLPLLSSRRMVFQRRKATNCLTSSQR